MVVLRSYVPAYLALSMCLVCTVTVSSAQTSATIRVEVDGPGLAFSKLIYQLQAAHGTLVARFTEDLGHGYGEKSQIALLTNADWTGWMTAIQTCLTGPRQQTPTRWLTRYRLTVTKNSQVHRRVFFDPEFDERTEAWDVLQSYIHFVRERVEAKPYWDQRLKNDERGWLRIHSFPAAYIVVDGIKTGQMTPIELPVAGGKHRIALLHPVNKKEWSYEVLVKPRSTTALNVELK